VEASIKEELGWKVVLLITNNAEAGAIIKAHRFNLPYRIINSKDFTQRNEFVLKLEQNLEEFQINFIALAGYLRKIPLEIVRQFPQRIVNIHPALLPNFGGKGLYGLKVHQAVLDAGCKITGVTVHLVDEEYDRGPIIAQRTVPVLDTDDAETLAQRVLEVEHKLYPEVITLFAQGRITIINGKVKTITNE
jgi:formyltetrahydrofolate-dependent phosphoribosylglycinamide formyltransferase